MDGETVWGIIGISLVKTKWRRVWGERGRGELHAASGGESAIDVEETDGVFGRAVL